MANKNIPGEISKDVTKPIDEYLKFIQQSFNTNGSSFKDISVSLKQLAKSGYVEASTLSDRLDLLPILKDINNYKKFDLLAYKISESDILNGRVYNVYKVADDVIHDIKSSKQWIEDYKRFSQLLRNAGLNNSHEQLLVLAKTILGRAVELCPIKTGFLRSSGIIIDMGNKINIAFTAPYSMYVHENMSISHPMHGDRNCYGRAKFLEIAVQEILPNKTVEVNLKGTGAVSIDITIDDIIRG